MGLLNWDNKYKMLSVDSAIKAQGKTKCKNIKTKRKTKKQWPDLLQDNKRNHKWQRAESEKWQPYTDFIYKRPNISRPLIVGLQVLVENNARTNYKITW